MTSKRTIGLAVAFAVLSAVGAARATAQTLIGVHYGAAPLQTLDVYPAPAAGAPLVVLVHGGGWREGDKRKLTSQSNELRGAGFAVATIDYRLDSETTPAFPMEVQDVEAATLFAREHALEWDADPARVEYVGGSAGGQLAADAAQRLDDAGEPVAKVVSLSGAFDLVDLAEHKNWPWYIPWALGCRAEKAACLKPGPLALAGEFSPSRHVDVSTCSSAWLLFNSAEEFTKLDQPERMFEALAAEGCSAELRIIPGTAHSFRYWPDVATQVEEALR
jgi:acetyl esterase/lipase